MANTFTANDAEAAVRQYLLYPEAEAPNRVQIWHALQATAQRMFLNAQNTNVNWGVRTVSFYTVPGVREYLVQAGDFGKDLCVYTKDAANTYHQAREVRRVEIQDINLYYNGPQQAGGSGHSEACVSFFKRDGSTYLLMTPIPAASVQYEIFYQTDTGMFGAGSDAFTFPQFAYLLAAEAALTLLPGCKWAELDKADTKERKTEIAMSLNRTVQKYETEFENWVDSLSVPGSFSRLGYLEEYV